MSSITKTHKVGLFAMFIAAALIGSVVAFDNMAYAGGSHHKKSNDAEQEIEQGQANEQNAQCVSGDFTIAGCNNLGLLFQFQDGNIAAGQQ
ncbi:hypothetical protein [Candidatus Nitrosocosmicus sp. SS]|jgi:hypothetical protein|uniref:hypothetical protein n=1 Tax=Candidatus Nitrosocosmicus agrestis TaxID=2563600 RepID=UPI00122DFAB7|nr:hypothetical protein [Candidatus Nitrosocosmicus sp. SS]KAA2283751.1 hypothetical protein F1Z66_00220 [Candidatus Nitrosocosmicus sp. SS]KAF0870127.1 hypothetical protein E5N71_00945 [Candidatus Nitrosocosmicus sp. SS]